MTDERWGEPTGGSPLGIWTIPGSTNVHRLDIVTGTLGSGTLQAWVDGQRLITLDRPKTIVPAVLSSPVTVDGTELYVYAESLDGGTTVHCDVYINGRSFDTGEHIGGVVMRKAEAERLRAARAEADRQAVFVSHTVGIVLLAVLVLIVLPIVAYLIVFAWSP